MLPARYDTGMKTCTRARLENKTKLIEAKSFIKLEVAPKEKHHDHPEADFFPKNSAKACVGLSL